MICFIPCLINVFLQTFTFIVILDWMWYDFDGIWITFSHVKVVVSSIHEHETSWFTRSSRNEEISRYPLFTLLLHYSVFIRIQTMFIEKYEIKLRLYYKSPLNIDFRSVDFYRLK